MDLNKEMLELADKWIDYCHNDKISSHDFIIESGKANSALLVNIISALDIDEESEEEILENYLSNVERMSRVLLKKVRENRE